MRNLATHTDEAIIKVLLVDDQPIIAEGIRRMLETEKDIQFHYCEDPSKAIDTAIDVNATIILQDLVMPDVDGMTLVRFYRANHATKDIPIIVLSSKEDPNTKSEAFGFGANDYLVKLPDPIELIARIRAHAKNYIMQIERDAAFFALREMKKKLEESNKKLKELTMRDGLTNISNRRHFDKELEEQIIIAQKTQGPLSLILIDIDHFKLYNDSYGHLQGDDCLISVAHTIDNECRNKNDMAARYGGEEFILLLPNTKEKDAQVIAERARKAVERLQIEHNASDTLNYVSISLGISTLKSKEKLDAKDLIELADLALYKSKEIGRNRVTLASTL
jgi:two-component system chemotaxis family response regulator WspR